MSDSCGFMRPRRLRDKDIAIRPNLNVKTEGEPDAGGAVRGENVGHEEQRAAWTPRYTGLNHGVRLRQLRFVYLQPGAVPG